jgi:hypothetical protein
VQCTESRLQPRQPHAARLQVDELLREQYGDSGGRRSAALVEFAAALDAPAPASRPADNGDQARAANGAAPPPAAAPAAGAAAKKRGRPHGSKNRAKPAEADRLGVPQPPAPRAIVCALQCAEPVSNRWAVCYSTAHSRTWCWQWAVKQHGHEHSPENDRRVVQVEAARMLPLGKRQQAQRRQPPTTLLRCRLAPAPL